MVFGFRIDTRDSVQNVDLVALLTRSCSLELMERLDKLPTMA